MTASASLHRLSSVDQAVRIPVETFWPRICGSLLLSALILSLVRRTTGSAAEWKRPQDEHSQDLPQRLVWPIRESLPQAAESNPSVAVLNPFAW